MDETYELTEEELEDAITNLPEIPYETVSWNDKEKKKEYSSGKSQFIDCSERIICVVDINGFKMPFYISTGLGGKNNVPTGKWYPFFGFGEDGWLNKTTEEEILDFYGIPVLRQIAEALDKKYGDLRGKFENHKVKATGTHIDFINQNLTPTSNGTRDTRRNIDANIANTKAALNKAIADLHISKQNVNSDVQFQKESTLHNNSANLTFNNIDKAIETGEWNQEALDELNNLITDIENGTKIFRRYDSSLLGQKQTTFRRGGRIYESASVILGRNSENGKQRPENQSSKKRESPLKRLQRRQREGKDQERIIEAWAKANDLWLNDYTDEQGNKANSLEDLMESQWEHLKDDDDNIIDGSESTVYTIYIFKIDYIIQKNNHNRKSVLLHPLSGLRLLFL